MKNLIVILTVLLFAGCKKELPVPITKGEIISYVVTANEGSGSIYIFNAATLDSIATVHLYSGTRLMMPHNVQASHDGEYVYVTVMPFPNDQSELEEELIEVHIPSNKITRRLNLGFMQHLAHVICSSDGQTLYITSTMKGDVIEIDRKTFSVSRRIMIGPGKGPHGIREAGGKLWIANIAGRSLSSVDILTGTTKEYFLGGMSYQVAADNTGKMIYVTQFDKGQIARLNTATEEIEFLELPQSNGPVQISLSKNNKHLVVCDQGMDYGQPLSNLVYLINAEDFSLQKTIATDTGPHGVVIDSFSKYAYYTCKVSGTVRQLELSTGEVTNGANSGSMPNGITWLNRREGI